MIKQFVVHFLLIYSVYCSYNNDKRQFNWKKLPEEGMTVPQLIRYFDYPLEIHKVQTEDGYVLTLQRIPYGRNDTAKTLASNPKREPVLLQHGLATSASCWIMNFPTQSLAFMLADQGFDVWLGNIRGNFYSQKHINMTKKEKKFWDFSWEEMAEYDLPAMTNHILNVTKFQQIVYIGHSQGTLIGFAKFSSDLKFAQKIKQFIALAPVASVGHITSPLRFLAPFAWSIQEILDLFGDFSLGKLTWLLEIIKPACDLQPFEHLFCENVIFFIAGAEAKKMINETRIPVYLSHNPDDTSMKNLAHFAQMVNTGKMRKYDYGFIRNWQIYGQLWPPEYHVENMKVETIVFWSPKDALADSLDVQALLPKLKHGRSFRVDGYSHLDFVWALNSNDEIYSKIIDLLKNRRLI